MSRFIASRPGGLSYGKGQALALRCGDGGWDDRAIARDRPSRYGIEDFPRHRRAGACPPPCPGPSNDREGQALALRCGEAIWPSNAREGQALALRYAEGGWDDRMIARDRPSRYGVGKVIWPSGDREGQALALRYGWQSLYNLHRLQTYRNYRTDEPHNSLRELRIVRVVGDLTSIVCLDPILIQHPL